MICETTRTVPLGGGAILAASPHREGPLINWSPLGSPSSISHVNRPTYTHS